MEKNFAHVVYAIEKGFWIGNHSFTHPHFSDITIEQARQEIEQTEILINKAYSIAQAPRPAKLFRFPYMDKGQKQGLTHVKAIQDLLSSLEFERLNFQGTERHPALIEREEDIDAAWTFDAREYALFSEATKKKFNLFKTADFVQRIAEELFQFRRTTEIVLFHDFEQTHELFSPLLTKLLDLNVQFRAPLLQKHVPLGIEKPLAQLAVASEESPADA